jgi:hypothetical protein
MEILMPNWQKVDIPPGGNFIGWGDREGQYVEGKVLDYAEAGGTDYNHNVCPQLEVELTQKASSFNKKGVRTFYTPGDVVTLTCGLYELRKGIIAAEPSRGDMIRIEMLGAEEIDGGNTLKRFAIQIAHGAAAGKKDRGNVRVVEAIEDSSESAAPAADDDDIPF